MTLPWLHGLEVTVVEPKPWVDLSTCPGPSLLSWLGLEVVEKPRPHVGPFTCPGPSLASWLGDDGGGTQTLGRPVHLPWTFPVLMAWVGDGGGET